MIKNQQYVHAISSLFTFDTSSVCAAANDVMQKEIYYITLRYSTLNGPQQPSLQSAVFYIPNTSPGFFHHHHSSKLLRVIDLLLPRLLRWRRYRITPHQIRISQWVLTRIIINAIAQQAHHDSPVLYSQRKIEHDGSTVHYRLTITSPSSNLEVGTSKLSYDHLDLHCPTYIKSLTLSSTSLKHDRQQYYNTTTSNSAAAAVTKSVDFWFRTGPTTHDKHAYLPQSLQTVWSYVNSKCFKR